MAHTKEPWRSHSSVVTLNNQGGFDLRGAPNAEENADRIVACVNACAGIETSLLESIHAKNLKLQTVGKVEETQAFMADIASKLDDLLTASKRYADKYCVDEADDAETCTLEQHEDAKALFRAIAKAEAQIVSLLADLNQASKHSRETVIVNSYGDTAEQVRSSPDWEANYQAYLIQWEREHKNVTNN